MTNLVINSPRMQQALEASQRRRTAKGAQRRAWEDPAWFVNEYMGRPTFQKQNEIILSVRDNRRTSIKGANSSGKDYMSGNILNWWLFCHSEAIVIVYGPTLRQVRDIIWREARRAFLDSANWLPGTMYPKAAKYFIDEYRYAEGFSASPDQDTGSGIQGFHSPNTLLIITEAHAVEAAEIEALIRLNPTRVLMTGNTLVQSGEFYESFHEKNWLYNTITISAFDTPNIQQQAAVVPGMITQQDIDETEQEYGSASPMYQARILAEFPDSLEDGVVARSAIMAAVDRELPPDDGETVILSCDVARFGDDRTVVYRRQGHQCRKVWDVHGHDTQQVAGELGLLAEAEPEGATVQLIVDETGLGGGVVDRLREENIRDGDCVVIGFNGGEKADDAARYVNAITEAWLELGRAFKEGTIDLDNNRDVISQLSSRRYQVQGDRRLRLEPKKDFKQRTQRSPDDADALAMAFSPVCGSPSLRFFDF